MGEPESNPGPPTTEEKWARLEEQAAEHLASVPTRDRLIVRDGLKASIAIGRAIAAHGDVVAKHCLCGQEHHPCEPVQAVRIARTVLYSVFVRGAGSTEAILSMLSSLAPVETLRIPMSGPRTRRKTKRGPAKKTRSRR